MSRSILQSCKVAAGSGFGKKLPTKTDKLAAFCAVDFSRRSGGRSRIGRQTCTNTSHRSPHSSTNLLPVSFLQNASYLDGDESGCALGPVHCRCVASRSIVGVSRRQAVGGRASHGTFYRPLVRVLLGALANGNLVRVLHRLLADCRRWMGHLTTGNAGRLLSNPQPAAVWQPVCIGEWDGMGQLVPVRVRT